MDLSSGIDAVLDEEPGDERVLGEELVAFFGKSGCGIHVVPEAFFGSVHDEFGEELVALTEDGAGDFASGLVIETAELLGDGLIGVALIKENAAEPADGVAGEAAIRLGC